MKNRLIHAILGLLIGAIVNILLNLLSSSIEQRAFSNDFSNLSIGWLIGLSIVGLLLGYWLGGEIQLPSMDRSIQTSPKISRLKALLSYIKLRGKGVKLMDILSIGSWIDIDTRE